MSHRNRSKENRQLHNFASIRRSSWGQARALPHVHWNGRKAIRARRLRPPRPAPTGLKESVVHGIVPLCERVFRRQNQSNLAVASRFTPWAHGSVIALHVSLVHARSSFSRRTSKYSWTLPTPRSLAVSRESKCSRVLINPFARNTPWPSISTA
jgi:hypothetical protein